MEASVERRTSTGSRIPLDVLVELTHEDFDEPFEADGVNLGIGGLSMRAPYLPDVGARMICRFEHPPTGERVEADAEVVWAQDNGMHTGEFGLRFVDMDGSTQSVIRRLVGSGSYLPPAPPDDDCTPEEPTAGPAMVELRLDGVGSPIVARVLHAGDDGLAVEQELPFLRLRTGVTAPDGRRGRIEAVDLSVDGETPKILLDIRWDGRSFVVPEAESTIPDFIPTGGEVGVAEADARAEAEAEDTLADEAPVAAAPVRQPSQIFHTTPPEVHAREVAEGTAAPAGARRSLDRARAALATTASRLGPWLARGRAGASALLARLGPLWAAVIAQGKRLGSILATRVGPGTRRTAGTVLRFASASLHRTRAALGRRFPRLAPAGARRRTTSAAPRESNVAVQVRKQRRVEVALEPTGGRRRLVAIALLAAAAVGFAIYAFTGDAEPEAARIDIPADIVAPADPEQGDTGAADAPLDVAPPAGAPEAVAPAPVQPQVPSALGDPSREAGPMPAPTFPSLREGGRPQSPQTLPEGSPYAVDVREEAGAATVTTQTTASTLGTAVFGAAEVADGRSFVIRMSRPVETIEGTRLADGFRVRVPGSLSLDRAGPIAAAHPLIDRSMILNRGDHAELSIRFVGGQSPAYRVTARGSAIEVVVAQR